MGKDRRLAFARIAFAVVSLLALTTCDAFKAGLGPKIDITGPTVDVKSIANGAYLHGTVVITGDVADVVGVKSVAVIVSINSAQVASIPATLSTASWSASLDTKALSGGKDTQANLDIKVTAGSGKTIDQNLVVYFDNTPPVFSSMTPSQAQLQDSVTYDYALSQKEAITGSVNDFGLNTVELDIGSNKNVVMTQTTKSAFSFTIDATQFYDAVTLAAKNGAVAQASLPYKVPYTMIAADFAGNTSTVTGNFYVKPGDGAPIFTFTNPAAFNATAYYPYDNSMGAVNSIKPGTSIAFHAFDMDGLDTSLSGLYVAFESGSSGLDYKADFDPSQPGSYTVKTVGNSGLTMTPTATLQLPGGTTITQGADISFSLPVTGQYQLLIRVSDLASNKINLSSAAHGIPAAPNASTSSRFASLFVSDGNPQVTVSLSDGVFVQTLNISGTVQDNTGPISITIAIAANASPFTSYPISPPPSFTVRSGDTSTADWSYSEALHALPDGTYNLSMVGENADHALTTPALARKFTIDSAPPTSAIATPSNLPSSNPAYWLSGAIENIGGTSTDAGSGTASVYYAIAPKASAQPAFSTSTWTLAAGTGNWNGTINLSGIGEGEFTLYVVAIDAIGNTETPASPATIRNFGVDQNPPTLTETNHSAASSTKSAFTLAGAIGDANALASLSITESKNSGGPVAVSGTTVPASIAGVKSAAYVSVSLPTAGVSDGSFAYALTATDIAGKTTVVNRTVKIDTTPPTVVLNAIPSWISSPAYVISGSGADPNASSASGVDAVQYQLDGGPWTNAAWVDTSGGANTTGTWNATLSGLIEGNHTIKAQATDAAGNTSVPASAAFGVDLNSPNLVVAASPATITAATGPSFTSFTGTLYDTNPAGVASLAVSSTQNGATVASNVPIAYPGTSASAGNPWSRAFAVDTAGHSTDGLWAFTFTATDISGKTAAVIRNMTIDTQPPTTTVTSPSSGGWVSTTSLSVTGVASDGAGTGVSKVYVKADGLYVASTSTDHGAEDPVASGWTLATGQTSWSASLTLTAAEGRKTLWIKAADVAGNLTSPAGAVASRVDFGLDLNPPTLGTTDSVGTLVNSAFTLAGTAADTNPAGLPTLAVSVDGGAAQAIAVAAGAWTFPVPVNGATHANDGAHTYVLTATDVAGKTTTLSRTITIDSAPPAAVIVLPHAYVAAQPQYWLSGATATMNGTASDSGAGASGIATVYYMNDALATSHASDNPKTASWSLAAGATNWSAAVNLTVEGQFTLWVAAYDNAGNLSSIVSQSYGVDQNPPTLTETNHAATSSTKSAFTLAGAIGDTNALASLSITESKDGGPAVAVTAAFVPASPAGLQSATYASQSLPLGGVSDGSYDYVLTVTDAAEKTFVVNRTVNIDTTPPTVSLTAIPAWVSSSAYTISGSATDPNAGASGIATIQYSLNGGTTWTNAAWTDLSGGANTNGTWSATLSALAEGNHSIIVRANDAASNVTTLGAAAFGVDVNPPTITETFLNTSAQVTKNSTFTMTGVVGDSNSLSVAGTTLLVSVSVNGGAAAPATFAGSAWSFNQAKVDGTYSYVITATDVSGKTTSLNRMVLLDSTPPSLGVASPTPAPGAWVSSTTLPISGSAQDGAGSGVKNIYYIADLASTDRSADVAAWNLTSGASAPTGAWTVATGLPGSWAGSSALVGEGAKILWIVAADKAGNTTALSKVAAGSFALGTVYTIAAIGTTNFMAVGATGNTVGLAFTATGSGSGTGSAFTGTGIAISFGLDAAAPTLAETAINTTATVVRNSSVTFMGSASDSNALATAHSLTVSVDGGAATDVAFAVAPAWSYTYSVNAATHAQDNTHSFLFTAADVAGKTTTVARSVQVDTTPATVAATSPTASAWTSASPYTVAGTASDGAGSGVSQVWTLVDLASNSHAADTMTTVTTGGNWKLASGTTNWTYSWTLAPEGSKTLWVAVLDSASNWPTSYISVNFGYDATPPALAINALGGYRTTFSIAGTVSDAASGLASLQYKIDSGTFSPVTIAASWSSPSRLPLSPPSRRALIP
jgi:hypothetical protein